MDAYHEHAMKCERLVAEFTSARFTSARTRGGAVGLGKSTSNLFRHRNGTHKRKMNVRALDRVLHVDPERMVADVEGMTTYETFVDETLKHGLLPTVVPQLKTITVGGAVSGIGIESSSFRFGLVHETVEEMEILLGDGRIMVCSRHENPDLFFGFPNSYGTFGYALRLKVRLIPARQFVHVRHTRYSDPDAYFSRISAASNDSNADYLDGTIFSGHEMYVTAGAFCDEAPHVSDYTYMDVYYKSIRSKQEDWLTAKGYIWRWDTDWFWCSKHFYVQNPLVRFAATRLALNSRTYQRIMRLSHKIIPDSNREESVIQDVDIPIGNAARFMRFLLAEVGITPIWVCPFRACDPLVQYDLYALDPRELYINFGFWDTVPTDHEEGYFNKKVEREALELNGKKGLYSTAYYDEETFWKIYNRQSYFELKKKYDPEGVFQDLYEKCVQRR